MSVFSEGEYENQGWIEIGHVDIEYVVYSEICVPATHGSLVWPHKVGKMKKYEHDSGLYLMRFLAFDGVEMYREWSKEEPADILGEMGIGGSALFINGKWIIRKQNEFVDVLRLQWKEPYKDRAGKIIKQKVVTTLLLKFYIFVGKKRK
ncbi:MAG: hypothetical protein Q8R26_02645 [bacterium]|nr:hypothetical protein [bacterium]